MTSRSSRNNDNNFDTVSTSSGTTISLNNENSSISGSIGGGGGIGAPTSNNNGGLLVLNEDGLTASGHNHVNINSNTNHNNGTTATIAAATATVTNLGGKYEKLVQDYVKLRSKMSILKKAYVEMSDAMGQKDQSLRKCEQEIEALTFRNQQLTSRVEMLQRELQLLTTSTVTTASVGGGGSNQQMKMSPSNSSLIINPVNLATTVAGNSAPSPSSSVSSNLLTLPSSIHHNHQSSHSLTGGSASDQSAVLAEELEHKINENTVLHRRLNESEMEFRQKLSKTEQSLKQVELEKAFLEKKLESLETSSKQTIERLQNDKIKLELNLIQLENQLRETHQEKESLLLQQTTNTPAVTINKNSSSTSSLASLPNINNSSIRSTGVGGGEAAPDVSALVNLLRSSAEALGHVYATLDERNALLKPFLNVSEPKLATRCNQALSALEARFTMMRSSSNGGGEQPSSPHLGLVDEFLELNRKLLQASIAELGVSTSVSLAQSTSATVLAKPSEDMDKLHKKLKIYLNKIDAFLFDTNNSNTSQNSDESAPCFSHYLSSLFRYMMTGSGISTTSSAPNSSSSSPLSSLNQTKSKAASLATAATTTTALIPSWAYRTTVPQGLRHLSDLIEKLLFVYNEKLSLEYTLEYATSITTLDECLVSYFGQLKHALGQLAALMSESVHLVDVVDQLRSDLQLPSPQQQKQQQQQEVEVVCSREEVAALKDELNKKINELKDMQDSYEQLKSTYEETVRLGDELKLRLERLQVQYVELDERRKSEVNSARLSSTNSSENQATMGESIAGENNKRSNINENSTLEKDTAEAETDKKSVDNKKQTDDANEEKPVVVETDDDVVEVFDLPPLNEDLIEMYMQQIATLNERIQFLDSKSVYYYDEAAALVERLKLRDEAAQIQANELDEVRDQLERTRSSYEGQMSTMSEHLIEMTDRMGRQAEENEKLKHDLEMALQRVQSSSSSGATGGSNHAAQQSHQSNKTSSTKSNKKSK